MLQGRSVGAHPQCPPPPPGDGVGLDAGVLSPLPEDEPSPLPPAFLRVPVYLGAAFLGADSSVPVGGGLAALFVGGGASTVCVGRGSGTGSGGGGGGGSGRRAMAKATMIAATAMPPPMNNPVRFLGGGGRSTAATGLGEAPLKGPPNGAPRPPNGASPSGAAPNGAEEVSAAGVLACDANALRSISPESSSALATLALGLGTDAFDLLDAVSAESEKSTLDSLRTPVPAAGCCCSKLWCAAARSSSLPACDTLPNRSLPPPLLVVARAAVVADCAAKFAVAEARGWIDAGGAEAAALSAEIIAGTWPS